MKNKEKLTVLIPSMLDFHFPLLKYAFLSDSAIQRRLDGIMLSSIDYDSGSAGVIDLWTIINYFVHSPMPKREL